MRRERIHKNFMRAIGKDAKLRSMFEEIKNNFSLELGSSINRRIDEIRFFTGVSRYDRNYFCNGFFTDQQYAKAKTMYFNNLKERIRCRLRK